MEANSNNIDRSKKRKKAWKIVGIVFAAIFLSLGLLIGWFFLNSASYRVSEPLSTDSVPSVDSLVHQGREKGTERGIYDGQGQRIQLRGVNAGNLLVQESWMSPFALEPETDAEGEYVKDKDGNITYPYFTEEDFRNGLNSNPNLVGKVDELMNYYYDSYFSDEDFRIIHDDLKFNCIRLPFYWRNILIQNEDGTFARRSEEEAFGYLDRFISRAAAHDIYVIPDLHGVPYSQSGYEHSGIFTDKPGYWDSEEAIAATVDIWKYVSEHYSKPENRTLSEAIAAYDLLNEPQTKKGTPEAKICFDVQNRMYQAIRNNGDNHLITIEVMWDPNVAPDPANYGWTNIMYQYHHYNWGRVAVPAFKAYMDMRQLGKDFDVPIYIGEFTCFEDEEVWRSTLVNWYDNRYYNWTIWSYKIATTGWWTSSWGVYTCALNLKSSQGETKLNVSTCTEKEFKKVCDKMKTSVCKTGTLKKVIDAYNSEWSIAETRSDD